VFSLSVLSLSLLLSLRFHISRLPLARINDNVLFCSSQSRPLISNDQDNDYSNVIIVVTYLNT
jgi:hypothetical protein